jgi:hypothetical protein
MRILFVTVTAGLLLLASAPRLAAEPIGPSILTTAAAEHTLFTNGGLLPISNGPCDSGPTSCSGTGTWTIFDDFRLTTDATMTGFTYIDGYENRFGLTGPTTVTWSLWSGHPEGTAPDTRLEGSGVAVTSPTLATVSSGVKFFTLAIHDLQVPLRADTLYWLGTSNSQLSGESWRAYATGNGLPGSIQTDHGQYTFARPDTFFTITGTEGVTAAPEPASMLLVATGAGFLLRRRRSA